MKESVGLSFTLQVMLIFIMIIVGYLSFSINYTKTIYIKNAVLNALEETGNREEAIDLLSSPERNFWANTGYTFQAGAGSRVVEIRALDTVTTSGARSCKYEVRVPVDLTIPVLNLDLNWDVVGETRAIYSGTGSCD